MDHWNTDKLWLKAKLFIDKANEHEQTSSEFAFWSSLSLECLARSALTKVHPALNADPRDEGINLLYVFGYKKETSQPRSLPAHSVYLRLKRIIEGFGERQLKLCDYVAVLRNGYLHTAELPYENLTPSGWLPQFYETTKILNEFLQKTLASFLSNEVAVAAEKLIKALNEEILGDVKKKIAAHKKVFESKHNEERQKLLQSAQIKTLLMDMSFGKQEQKCPACGADGMLLGDEVKRFPPKYENGELLVDVQYLSSRFNCTCCGLVLNGVEEITHAGLDTHYKGTVSTSLHELYEPEFLEEYDNM